MLRQPVNLLLLLLILIFLFAKGAPASCCYISAVVNNEQGGDKYRSYLTPEDINNTKWISGPPNYDLVNKLFEQGRTNIWPDGSLEEQVQRLVKTWEMEIVHKADPNQYKTLDANNFLLGINGKRYFTLKAVGEVGGSYQVFLQTSLPAGLRFYDPDQETYNSSQTAFKKVFARGFALEILQVYSGPPHIAYKFRHWGYFEGSYKDYPATGELIEIFGIGIFELDENSEKVVKVEFFHDRGELLAGLIKGKKNSEEEEEYDHSSIITTKSSGSAASTCPFMAYN